MPRLLLAALLALLAPMALAPAALAQTCTTSWTNPAGGAFDAAANWDNGAPSPSSTACITLAGTYTVALTADRDVSGLVLGGASGTQTLTSLSVFRILGDAVVRPNGRWEVLNRTPGGEDGVLTTGTITVEGVLVQNSGTTLLGTAGVLDVAPGGTLRVVGNGVGAGGTGSLFRIRGTLEATDCPLTTSNGNCQVNAPLDVQGGTVRAAGGVFFVRGGGTLANATVDAVAGATLFLDGAPAALAVSGTLAGSPAGTVFLNGGTVTAATGGATLNVTGAGLLLSGNVVLTGGTFRNTGRLVQADGVFSAVDGTTLLNAGRFVIPGTAFGVRNGGRIRNEASGTLELAGGGGIGFNGTVDGRLENAGVLLHTALTGAGTGETGTISVPYDGLPDSVVRTETGRLDFQTGGTLRDVSFDVPAGAGVLLAGVFVGEGTIGGNIQGDIQITDELRAAAGVVTLAFGGTGLVATRGSFRSVLFTSSGGTFRNTGVLGTGGLGLALRQAVLDNAGTLRLGSGVQLLDGSLLRNLAGATVELISSMSGDGRFENAGLVVTSGTGSATGFGGRLRSLPGSELRTAAGAPRLDLDAPGARTLPDGTTLSGTGLVLFQANLEPEGIVSPGTEAQPVATLSSFNAYLPSLVSGSPRLVIDVDAGGQSDVFAIGGAARLTGALVVRVRPGYVPAVGDPFTVLTSASGITGQFTQVVAEGAPSGIAFVAERSADGFSVVLRAVAAAPGGALNVSTTTPVGGGRRTVFLFGPGAPGVTAARLDCTDCLDPAAFGTVPAQVVGEGPLREARFDLTSPRVIGLYTLVLVRPGQPDEVVPLTVRPYISAVNAEAVVQRGLRVRPAGSGYNYSVYELRNLTNAPAGAVPFVTLDRPAPASTGLVVATDHNAAAGSIFAYNSDASPDRLAIPMFSASVPLGFQNSFEAGLRIDPTAVLFPGETRTGPEDTRLAFGEGQHFFVQTTSNTSFERAAATAQEALRSTASPALSAYLASVDGADPAAVPVAVGEALRPSVLSLAGTDGLLAQILTRLDATVATPGGLAAGAAPAFAAALRPAVDALQARETAAYTDALAASGAVRALYEGELAALGITFAAPRPAADLPRTCERAILANSISGIREFCPCEVQLQNLAPGVSTSDDCPKVRGPVDPNDKLADTDLICQFGTVVVDGQPETRCVRYFVPRARATEPVAYTVTFENRPEANAPAEYVTVTDDIDPAFDIGTLQVLATSSDSTFSYSVSGRTVTFRFVGIDLPPNVTAPEGEGFVRYSVRPNAGLPDGTEIRNTAGIVFDFNPPILTPTVLHEIRTVADLGVIATGPDFVVVGTAVPVTVSVTNLRGDAATAAAVTILTGGGSAQATPSTGACTGSGPITCTFGDLAAGETGEVELTFASPPLGAVTVSATATTTAFDGFAANDTDLVSVGVATVGTEADPDVPRELTLSSPRPNPVRGATTLRWGLPQAASVDVRVYDLLGREVARLADGDAQEAGWHEVRWEAQVASGVYVVRVRVGDDVRMRRLTVVR